MKPVTGLLLSFICLVLQLSAQVNEVKKPATLALHFFYYDFNTAQQIRSSSLQNVFNNGLWSKIGNMQMGMGFNYLKGINKNIDIAATLDGSYTDYLFRNGTTNGSTEFLLDANAGLNIKLLTDRHAVVPYLSVGAGISLYKGSGGLYIPLGIGLQFNLFNEAFIFTNMQYRNHLLQSTVNDHFQYSIGIGTPIGKKKKVQEPVKEVKIIPTVTVAVTVPPVVMVEVKLPVKNIVVKVTDWQTGLALPAVKIVINGPDGNINGFSDTSGQLIFTDVKAADYAISGLYHGINTTKATIAKNSFDVPGQELSVSITHNDPRFTLKGNVRNKNTHHPEKGVTVNVINNTQGSSDNVQDPPDGNFSIQLEASSDFTVSGKKSGYISNIEKLSTKGLNRSSTLYVALELAMEEAIRDKTISLKDIYYDIASFRIRSDASPDLEKLVKFLKDNPGITIEIASHTDSRGSNASNLKLSQARAQEVVNYLQNNGIAKNRLIPRGFGETRLVNGCTNGVSCTEAQHEQNRRTEFKVISN